MNQVHLKPLFSESLELCYIVFFAFCMSQSQVQAPDMEDGMSALSHNNLDYKSLPMQWLACQNLQ